MATAISAQTVPSIFCCRKVEALTKHNVTESMHIRYCVSAIAEKSVPRQSTGSNSLLIDQFLWIRKVNAMSGGCEDRQILSVHSQQGLNNTKWTYCDMSPEMVTYYLREEGFEKSGYLVEFGCSSHPMSRYVVQSWERVPESGVFILESPEEILSMCGVCHLFKPSREWFVGNPFLPLADRCHICQLRKQLQKEDGTYDNDREIDSEERLTGRSVEWRRFLEKVWRENKNKKSQDPWERILASQKQLASLGKDLVQMRKWSQHRPEQQFLQKANDNYDRIQQWRKGVVEWNEIDHLKFWMDISNLVIIPYVEPYEDSAIRVDVDRENSKEWEPYLEDEMYLGGEINKQRHKAEQEWEYEVGDRHWFEIQTRAERMRLKRTAKENSSFGT